MKFGLSENANKNKNNNNKKLAEEINKIISATMQTQIINAVKEYKVGKLILLKGDYSQVPDPKTHVYNQDYQTLGIFCKLLFRDYYNSISFKKINFSDDSEEEDYNETNDFQNAKEKPVIYKDGMRVENGKPINTCTIGIREEYVDKFIKRWNKFYCDGSFNVEYFEELTAALQAGSPSPSPSNLSRCTIS